MWASKLREGLSPPSEKKPRKLIALDESCVDVDGFILGVFRLDVEPNEPVYVGGLPHSERNTPRSGF